jgi:hypothetical protein
VAAEFPILGPALTDSYSWDRLQRFAAAAGHRSLRSAARTLGNHPTCLFKQVHRLERDLGAQLLIRTPTRYQTMQLTALGTEIVAAVRKRLKANGIDANPDGTEDTQRFVRQTGFELPNYRRRPRRPQVNQ